MVRDRLARRARRVGLQLDGALLAKLETYFELLRRWNRKISLTSLPVEDNGDEAIDRLLIEPLVAVKQLPLQTQSLFDVGSGGGSPAVPIKLAAPQVFLRMIESKTRKAAFLRELVRQLELSSTEVETGRFEQLVARPELHEAADVISLRAVRVDRKALTTLQVFLKPGGLLFLFRTGTTRDEVELAGPPFVWVSSHSLLENLHSRLVIFQNRL